MCLIPTTNQSWSREMSFFRFVESSQASQAAAGLVEHTWAAAMQSEDKAFLHLSGFSITAFLSLSEVRWISSMAARRSLKSVAKVISAPDLGSSQPDLVDSKPSYGSLVEEQGNLYHIIKSSTSSCHRSQWERTKQPCWISWSMYPLSITKTAPPSSWSPACHRNQWALQWGMSRPSWTLCSLQKHAFHLSSGCLQGRLTPPFF